MQRTASVDVGLVAARELYRGGHWNSIATAFNSAVGHGLRVELWVASAGYGLISAEENVRPYSATFASGVPDAVWRGADDGVRAATLRSWWSHVSARETLVNLFEADADARLVVVAGEGYVTAMRDELDQILQLPGAQERVSIVSAGSRGDGVLPVDAHFQSIVGGTRLTLNARVLELLAKRGREHGFERSRMAGVLGGLRASAARSSHGRPLTDEQVVSRIDELVRQCPGISRSRALQLLRRSGEACEQGRFARLWAMAGSCR